MEKETSNAKITEKDKNYPREHFQVGNLSRKEFRECFMNNKTYMN